VPRDVRGGPNITTPAVVAWGAGFAPLDVVSLRLAGNWMGEGKYVETNPEIWAAATNTFGAFNVTISSALMTFTIRVFNVTPGLYSILAVQDEMVVASAPLRILP
jgi:hypothetical protein